MAERAEPKVLTLDRFKHLIDVGEDIPSDAVLRKATVFTVKAVADDDRALQFAISDESVDRDADTLAVDGWKLTNYRRNPVVLFAHDYRQPPVARAKKLFVEDSKLKAIDHFVEREIYPFADTVLQMVKGGYLNATSVGFLPMKWERVDSNSDRPDAERGRSGGIDFKQQELLEHSIVPVPSNPAALVEARSVLKGADFRAYVKELERFLDAAHGEEMIVVPRKQLEEAWALLRPKSVATSGTRDDPPAKPKGDYPPAIPPAVPPALPSGDGGGTGGSGAGGSETTPTDAGVRDAELYNALILHFDGLRTSHQTVATKLKNLTGSKRFLALIGKDPAAAADEQTPDDAGQALYELAQIFLEHHDNMARAMGDTCYNLGEMLEGEDTSAGSAAAPPAKPKTVPVATPPAVSATPPAVAAPKPDPVVELPSVLRDALDEVKEELAAFRYAVSHTEKGVIAYKRTPLAPESSPWDASKEVASASVDDMRVMSAWFAGDGTKKGDYKLPHHHASGNHATVWRGVANAAARMAQTSLPAGDVPGVKKHIAGHYKDFGKEAPWKAAPEQWETYEVAVRAMKSTRGEELTDLELAHLLELTGFDDEATILRSPAGDDDPTMVALQILGIETDLDEGLDLGDGVVLSPSELVDTLRNILPDAVGQATRRALAAATGRLD